MSEMGTPTERGHAHYLIPYDDYLRADGIRHVWSRCVCGLEERRSTLNGNPYRVEYRLGGVWMPALELIRRRDVPVQECPDCEQPSVGELAPCRTCRGVGVLQDGRPVEIRLPAPPSEPTTA